MQGSSLLRRRPLRQTLNNQTKASCSKRLVFSSENESYPHHQQQLWLQIKSQSKQTDQPSSSKVRRIRANKSLHASQINPAINPTEKPSHPLSPLLKLLVEVAAKLAAHLNRLVAIAAIQLKKLIREGATTTTTVVTILESESVTVREREVYHLLRITTNSNRGTPGEIPATPLLLHDTEHLAEGMIITNNKSRETRETATLLLYKDDHTKTITDQ